MTFTRTRKNANLSQAISVNDNLDGTLMSVNNNAGLPVLEVFSDDKIVGGRFGENDFVVSSSGNVGIGVANPSTKLEVSGTITATTLVKSGGTSSQFLKADGTVDSSTYVTSLSHNHGIANSAGTQQFTFGINDNVRIAGGGATSIAFDSATKQVTISSTDTNTTYTANNGIVLNGTTFSHVDTSSQGSVDNSNGTVIQDVTLDTYGHVTALGSVNLDGRYYTESEVDTLLSSKLDTSLKGTNNGLAELDSTGKVPSSQLPSYVDDVLEYADLASFPTSGEESKIYIAWDTNKTYRWSGTGYIEISASLALGESGSTAYRGDRGKTAYDHSQVTTGAIHGSSTVGTALFRISNNSTSIKFIRVNADNTLTYRTGSEVLSDIGAYAATNPNGYTTNTGTVTSVAGTGSVAGLTLTGTVTTTGSLTLDGTLSVDPSNFSSQTAKTFLAAPNGSAGTPTFRTIVASDIPTLNQNTTGTAANITATSNTTLTTLSNLVSIGTITTGVWSASTIGVNKGGTGATTFTTGEVLVGNGTGAVSTLSRSGIDSRSTFTPSAHNQAESTITFTDITTGNASTSAHGYLPKLGGGTTNYLRADGSWATPPDTNTTYSGSTSIILTGGSFQRAALTGDVTAAQNNNGTTIANNAVTNAKAADMAVNTIKGRITAGTGDPEDLTAANVRSIINVENGAQVNTVTSVAGKTGAVTLNNSDVGLGNVANVAALPLAGGTMTGAISFAAGQTWPTFNQNTTGTSAGVNTTVAVGSYANLVYATIGTNDYFRIRAGGAADAGDVEIATADNGNEPIYVRQYSGAFATLTRTATLLDSSGNTTFPGSVTAGSFVKTLGVGQSSTDLLQAGGGVVPPGSLSVSYAGTAGSANQVANTLTRGSYLTGNNFNGSAATTWAVDADTANTASKIVARDASGNFSAGTVNVTQLNTDNLDISSRYTEKVVPISIISSGLAVPLDSGNLFTTDLNSGITSISISGVPSTSGVAMGFSLIFTADGTARTVTWPNSIKWADGTAPTLTSTNNKKDVLSFVSTDNGTSWLGFVGGQNY